ncbi:MAG: hypothetical protein ACR5K7_04515 [Symbiopectobacterium sp.]
MLDEPLNNLDIKHVVAMMKQIRRITDELGKTIVLVIHDINFASAYLDYIYLLGLHYCDAQRANCLQRQAGGSHGFSSVLESIFNT